MPTPFINSIASWFMTKRMHQIELFMKYPLEVQNEWLFRLINSAKDTEWGIRYGYADIYSLEIFKERVPIQDYESLKPSIERIRRGEQNVLWNTEIKWFAKSSGTTNDKSKFIPLSQESLEDCHYKGGKDMVSIHCSNYPEAKLFTGKNLALGGSHQKDIFPDYESYHGDVSAIIIQNLPMWAEFLRAPSLEIALLNNWDEKLEKLTNSTINENVTSVAGVPSWMLILLKRMLENTGKKTIADIWPNLEVYFHGGVSLLPYKEQFKSIFNLPGMHYLELYNASEGFFGIQDQKDSDELLLMLDYGIYYEFQPMEEWDKESGRTLSLDEVKTDTNYALIISTNAGLWRYRLGDTIKFTALHPFRFRISGRTKHFINAFGEELMIDNAEMALKTACERSGASMTDYTAAPVFMEATNGAHEWLIEFERAPENAAFFAEVLDNTLKALNSDYEAKRYNNYALRQPVIHFVKPGTFYNWLKEKGKLGGQNKVPRLCNDRRYVEAILKVAGSPICSVNI
jgi:hypothetical protein